VKILHVDSGREWRGGQRQVLFHLRAQREAGLETVLLAYEDSPLALKAREEGFSLFQWRLRREFSLPSVLLLKRILGSFSPHIVHVHDSRSVTPVLLATGGSPLPTVATRRVDFPVSPLSARLKYGSLSRVVAISQAVERELLKGGLKRSKLVLIPSGIDPDEGLPFPSPEEARRELEIPSGAIHVGAVGSLVDHKGHIVMVQAASLLMKHHKELFFSIAGEGPLREKLSEAISTLDSPERFRLMGFLPKPHRYLSSLDIYLQPSLLEGLGTSLLDALAHAIPSIASRTGGIPEILEGAGVLVPPGEPLTLAQALENLVDNPQERLSLGRQARERAELYHYTQTNRPLLRLYDELSPLTSRRK